MKKKHDQKRLSKSWDRVLSSEQDIVELLKKLEIQDLKDVKIVSRTLSEKDGPVLIIDAKDNNENPLAIIIDATAGIPTWKQFINVTYEQGSNADLKIILYQKDYAKHTFNLPAGGPIEISNLVYRNNRCRRLTYLVKGITRDSNGYKIKNKCLIEAGPEKNDFNYNEELPSKRKVQEAEFWAGYYFPQWACDGIGINDDIINCWAPQYSLGNNLRTEASWNDDGFFISLIGEPGSETIKWICENRKNYFEKKYPDCPVLLKVKDEKAYAISVRINDISMTDLIKMTPCDKRYYGDMVISEEGNFRDVADEVIEKYNERRTLSMSEIKVVIPMKDFEYMQNIVDQVNKMIGELRPESTIHVKRPDGIYDYPANYTGKEEVEWKKVDNVWTGIITLINILKRAELQAKGIESDDYDTQLFEWNVLYQEEIDSNAL